MKEKIKKITKILKKYLPDILFLTGTWILSYNLLKPAGFVPVLFDYTQYKVLGIMLIAFAFDIAIRRYFAKRNSE